MQNLIIIVFLILVAATAGYVVKEKNFSDEPKETIDVESESDIVSSVRNTLDLSGQGLTKTPSYVFDRTSTQELNLSNNNLDGALQAEVRHLQNLKILNLSNNKFTGVPAEVGQLKNLEILDLSNNLLTGLPYELGNLKKLKLLDLRGNDYSEADLSKIKEDLPSSTVIKTD